MTTDEGTITVEAAVVAPVLLVLMLLVVYAGRASQADADVRSAAARAARAASIAGDPVAATTAASEVAGANLRTAGVSCVDFRVEVDTDAFAPGGVVSVQVGCRIGNGDLALVAVPGSRWSVASATQVVDTYRGGG